MSGEVYMHGSDQVNQAKGSLEISEGLPAGGLPRTPVSVQVSDEQEEENIANQSMPEVLHVGGLFRTPIIRKSTRQKQAPERYKALLNHYFFIYKSFSGSRCFVGVYIFCLS